MKKTLFISFVVSIMISCKVNYSFTGASISPDIKTVSVAYIQNRAPLASPTLSQTFAEALRDIFLSQTNLNLKAKNGDIKFEGYISNYTNNPIAIQGNETASLNRLSVSVQIKFTNTKDSKQDYDKTFTQYSDYESTKSLSEVEETLLKEINGRLVQEIFNQSVSNW